MSLPSLWPAVLVFVYGTLTDPDVVAGVLDDWSVVGPATLEGLHRVEGRYPTLAPGGSTDGRLLETDDLAALDAYEGVDRGLYVRVPVPLHDAGGGPDPGREVAVYVGDPDRLDAPASWPGRGPFADRVAATVAEEAVTVRREP